MYAVSKHKKLTLKHIGIGMALYQAKTLVELVHHAGHCISYEQVRRLDTTLAQENLQWQSENENVPIPSNLKANKFFQFAADNIDIIEATLDGMGTFHATQMVTFQRGKKQQAYKRRTEACQGEISPGPIRFPHITSPKVPILIQPKFSEQVEELWYAPDPNIVEESNIKDPSWIVLRIHDDEGRTVPAWTGFNQLTEESNIQEICSTGYLPLTNAPAHKYDALDSYGSLSEDLRENEPWTVN